MSYLYWNVTLVSILNNTTDQINRYFSLFIFGFGIIGNILNVLVLARKSFRSNPCALFFLVASIANLISILGGLTSRMLSGWAADLTSTIGWICKLRIFIVWVSRTFAIWVILLATIDRWLWSSTDIHRQQIRTLKNTYRTIIGTLILSTLVYVELIYCYDANIKKAPSECYSKTYTCRLVTDFSYAFVTNAIPIFFMLVFGAMTISRIRHTQNRIQSQGIISVSSANNRTIRSKKTERHLLITLLVQVMVFSILLIPAAIQKIYATLTINYNKSSLQNAIENLLFNIVVLFSFTASGSSFYIFTLYGGKRYRKAVRKLMKNILKNLNVKLYYPISCFNKTH